MSLNITFYNIIFKMFLIFIKIIEHLYVDFRLFYMKQTKRRIEMKKLIMKLVILVISVITTLFLFNLMVPESVIQILKAAH